MEDPGSEIPRLERLMRDVIRAIFERDVGPEWLAGLSRSVTVDIDRAREVARKHRPTEALRDGWDAAPAEPQLRMQHQQQRHQNGRDNAVHHLLCQRRL